MNSAVRGHARRDLWGWARSTTEGATLIVASGRSPVPVKAEVTVTVNGSRLAPLVAVESPLVFATIGVKLR